MSTKSHPADDEMTTPLVLFLLCVSRARMILVVDLAGTSLAYVGLSL